MNENSNTNNTGREIDFPEISDNLNDFLTKDAERLAPLAENTDESASCEEMEYLPSTGLIYFKKRGLILNIRDISGVWTDNLNPDVIHISLRSEYSDYLIKMSLEDFANKIKQI